MKNPFQRFFLRRNTDVSGVSGTGIVAQGVRFSTGQVVLCWLRETEEGFGSIATYQNLEQCHRIHGHNGNTVFDFEDYKEAANG